MTTRALMSLALSTLAIGGGAAAVLGGGVASASAPNEAALGKAAAAKAKEAGAALAGGRTDAAVALAEQAVTLRPQLTAYRLLLGQAYLKAGRFTSARAAFADALTLEPGNGKAAINLALVETGLGDWAGARAVLEAHGATMPAADRGLALALAGDPAGAVELLTAAVRSPEATVTTRQNLALALALAGRWPQARVIAAMDLAPADVDARLEQWAAFAHPSGAADQVAALLGVTPVADGGEPVALALNAAATPVQMAAAKLAADVAPASVAEPSVAVASASVGPAVAGIQFAAPSPVVQPLPAVAVAAAERVMASPGAYKVALRSSASRPASRARGDWFVQIGAYQNASIAHDDWTRATRRDAAFRSFTPEGMTFQVKGAAVYRLSVGGFARGDADALCRAYRAKGGRCFVRQGAGEQIASWARKDVQLAMR